MLQTADPTPHRVAVPTQKEIRISTLHAVLRSIASANGSSAKPYSRRSKPLTCRTFPAASPSPLPDAQNYAKSSRPFGSGISRPNSRAVSTHSAITTSTFASASCRVAPSSALHRKITAYLLIRFPSPTIGTDAHNPLRFSANLSIVKR